MGKAERTKQYILEKASIILNEKGISGTTVDSVLEAADVARGCLYGHFLNKDALCNETADYLLDLNDRKTIEFVTKEKTAKGRIHAYLKFNSDPLNTVIQGGCPIMNLAAEADDNNPVIKEKVKKNMIAAQKFLSDILDEGIKNGEFKDSLNPDEFAIKLFSSVQGGIVIGRTLGSAQPMRALIKSLKSELKTFEK
ncbi:TetR/AcrR family transcriptional regulator [Dyadobacter subterraneus]|uniref:TetR/AcrR family transcriptional regulator n=1 Tax=Dyadobacter subterraneus TaxID=2773304 RepID=A0ABR9W8W0_9BACT|nr:TetR/AcrR family transcriptional regulator [Dyadobacter subterraneus]MBE9461917.1 TetR/AcrR family transcriptional regulator [Dyadobacter subterraneus]